MTRLILAALLAAGLMGCAQGKTPLDDAFALNGEYQTVAHAELAFMKSPLADDCSKQKIKAADMVAFSYVSDASAQALAWSQAPDTDKPKQLTLFDRVMLLGNAAVTGLPAILTPCAKGN
jgi:hypothetical protein